MLSAETPQRQSDHVTRESQSLCLISLRSSAWAQSWACDSLRTNQLSSLGLDSREDSGVLRDARSHASSLQEEAWCWRGVANMSNVMRAQTGLRLVSELQGNDQMLQLFVLSLPKNQGLD